MHHLVLSAAIGSARSLTQLGQQSDDLRPRRRTAHGQVDLAELPADPHHGRVDDLHIPTETWYVPGSLSPISAHSLNCDTSNLQSGASGSDGT